MADKKENVMEAWEVTDKIRAWIIFHPELDEVTTWVILQDGEVHVLKELDLDD